MKQEEMMKGVSKADRNPVIMDIHYKTKLVDIKTKLRAKLVIVKDYFCPTDKCVNHLTKCSKQRLNPICYVGNKIICPACKTELVTEDKKIIKIYTPEKYGSYINLETFLSARTMFNFRKNRYGQIACFVDDIDTVSNLLIASKERLENNQKFNKNTQKFEKVKGIHAAIKTYPLTWEVLEEKWERVKQLRLVEAI